MVAIFPPDPYRPGEARYTAPEVAVLVGESYQQLLSRAKRGQIESVLITSPQDRQGHTFRLFSDEAIAAYLHRRDTSGGM